MDIICPFRAKYAQPVEKSAFIQILRGTRHDAVEGLKIMQCIGSFERMICVFYKKKRQFEPPAFVFYDLCARPGVCGTVENQTFASEIRKRVLDRRVVDLLRRERKPGGADRRNCRSETFRDKQELSVLIGRNSGQLFDRGAAAKLNRLLDPLRLTAQTGRQRRIADCADLVSALTRQLRAVVQQRSVDLVANAREQDGKFL